MPYRGRAASLRPCLLHAYDAFAASAVHPAGRGKNPSSALLRRGALDALRPRTLRAVGNLELDAITLAQICDAFAIDSALVKEIFLPGLTLDHPKAFVHSPR